jgi:3-hydroxybutyrate dehydrogenase
MPNYDLAKKVAVVTGSTSGIGAAIAEGFAQNGAHVVLNGIESEEQVLPHVERLQKDYGVEVFYSGADMSKPDQIAAMGEAVLERFGQVDFLVNNAGIQYKARIEDFPENRWELIMAINLSSAFYTTKAFLPQMQKRDFGRIVNIASAHGLRASEEKVAYVAAKHGVMGLTKVTALENAEQNITANTVCPGWVKTDLVKKQIQDMADKNGVSYEEQSVALVADKQPNKRFSSPEAIAQAVLYFADPDNSCTTGSHLSVDGGWTAK